MVIGELQVSVCIKCGRLTFCFKESIVQDFLAREFVWHPCLAAKTGNFVYTLSSGIFQS